MTDLEPSDHVAHDDLVALALQAVEPAQRARLLVHLGRCGSCQGEYAALENDVRRALAAAPAIAPPAGFSGRVLTAMGMAEPARSASGRRRRWTPLLTAAAALLVGLGLGIGGTLAVQGGLGVRPPANSAAPAASALVTRSGETVGTAGLTVLAGRDSLVVTVTRGRPGLAYSCVVVGQDGQRHSAGTWTLGTGGGASYASGTWVVPLPAGGVAQVELVGPSGSVWSRAEF